MNKKAIFITVRTGSTRLPNKALLEIHGRPTIEQLIRRVSRSKKKDLIVLCTTDLSADNVLCDIAQRNGIEFFRGSVNDKLERWKGAAERFGVEFLVTADGDDLFCEPELLDLAIDQYNKGYPDFIEGQGLICGAFTYGIKTSALQKVCQIKDTVDTEMMWIYFKDTGLFKCEPLMNVPAIYRHPEIRMTLDYDDDLKFFKAVFDQFYHEEFSLKDVILFLERNPEVIKINQYLQEKFLENQKKKTKLVVKAAA